MSVGVNPPKTPVTKGSSGIARATLPNICKMPGPPAPFVPAPLPNIGKSGDKPDGYTKKVTIEGKPVAVKGASFGSMGDMASKGTGGGMVSANTHGPCKFIGPGSMDVKFEGKNVHLLSDLMTNNGGGSGSPANSATMMGLAQDSSGGGTDVCGQCGGSHPGLQPGDKIPKDTTVRRGIPSDKIKPDGSISKSAFKDSQMSVDIAGSRSPASTMAAPHLKDGGYVECTVAELEQAFPGNEVVFDCVEGNPHHCSVEGKKTDGQCNTFSKNMTPRLVKP